MMPVVRNFTGRLEAVNDDEVRKLLDDGRENFTPEIRRLKGNRAHHVGIHRENNAMTNVSVWDIGVTCRGPATKRQVLVS